MMNGNQHRWMGVVVMPVVVAALVSACGHGPDDADATDDATRGESSGTDPSPAPVALRGIQSSEGPWPVADEAARAAAVDGIAASLSYRWDTIEEDAHEARALSSSEFWDEASSLWGMLAEVAPETRTISDITVLADGVVSQDEARGVYLVLLDHATSTGGGPSRNRDQSVLVTVVVGPDAAEAPERDSNADAEDATWLLDDVSTAPSDFVAASGGPVEAAEGFVRALSTYGEDHMDDATLLRTQTAVEDATTAELFDQLLGPRDTIGQLVETGEESELRVTAAALADIDADAATVLVVGSSGQRLSVEMVLADGKWLASDVSPVA